MKVFIRKRRRKKKRKRFTYMSNFWKMLHEMIKEQEKIIVISKIVKAKAIC